jgi:hypothetical protein
MKAALTLHSTPVSRPTFASVASLSPLGRIEAIWIAAASALLMALAMNTVPA